jgi:acetyl-CoA C-acetyltransferase/acetyl-CoA acyltransferase
MAHWYKQAIEHARRCPQAQEYHNKDEDLLAKGMMPPNPKAFCEHINVFDCSKVTDGASALLVCSEEGLARIGVSRKKVALVVGLGQSEADLTAPPRDQTALSTTKNAVDKALAMAGLGVKDLGLVELHDCFSITGLLSLEALGVVGPGEAADYVSEGRSLHDGELPTNCSGGLCGFGHPTGGTGVRQAVDIMRQVTGQAGDYQVPLKADRPHGLMVNMGGNDITVTSMIARRAE